ncbi:laccase [Pisolithus tinctorius Marx 270]|uniref:laccase n=2 Tax=Pisolithus tinctorius Marx 270 TaxID=870435 RepID=A0A0C3IUV2_PISTI|nr:laccase [Pisolithus tinctorius Marx 270]
MDITTSTHWHGIFQRRANWAEEPHGLPSAPSNPTEASCTGSLYRTKPGRTDDPLADMYDVDDELTIFVLSGWFVFSILQNISFSSLRLDRYHKPSPLLYNPPFTPDCTLINGPGRGPSSPLAVLNITQGQRCRFRIIGASCDPWFNFTIDGHNMTVIEADGNEVEPVIVDSLAVYAGQRYSVVVTADQPVDNYWIRSVSNFPNQTFDGRLNSVVLRYGDAPIQDPTTDPGPGVPGIPGQGNADVNINLITGINVAQGVHTVDSVAFVDPPPPVLQNLSGAQNPSRLLPNGSVYELPPYKTIETSIPATDLTVGGALGGPHPIHLHGRTFDVVCVAGNSTYNYVNPVRRDTVSLGSQAQNDNVTIRFTTNNPVPRFFLW